MTEPTVSIEDAIGEDNPELAEAMRKAQTGVLEHTLLQIWEEILIDQIAAHSEPANMDTYEAFMRNWSWIKYEEIESVREILGGLLKDILDDLHAGIIEATKGTPRTKALVFESAEDDWNLNQDIYVEVLARWLALASGWGRAWAKADPWNKKLMHPAIAIAVAQILGQQGLNEQVRHLANFDMTDELAEKMNNRTKELIDALEAEDV